MSGSTITYHINNHDLPDPVRTVELVDTDFQQLEQLSEQGYLVRERLIQGELLDRLRTAVDELARESGGAHAAHTRGDFGGLFVRSVLDRHVTFLNELLKFAPTLSLARAALGPQVQIHGAVIRVTYPDAPNQDTHWHWHQRVVPTPIPPFFSQPWVIDNLIYLDDTDEHTGGLAVLPGSHRLLHEQLPASDRSEMPGQVILQLPAGSCVTATGSIWHRGLPSLPGGRVRRLLILGYSPTWMKPIDRFGDGLTGPLLDDPATDDETRELLGHGGYY